MRNRHFLLTFPRLFKFAERQFYWMAHDLITLIWYRKTHLKNTYKVAASLTHDSTDATRSPSCTDISSLNSKFDKGLSILTWPNNKPRFDHLRNLGIFDCTPGVDSLSEAFYHPRSIGLYRSNGDQIAASQTFRGTTPREQISTPPSKDFPADTTILDPRSMVYMGPLFGQYGHFLTETIARLWYVVETKYEGSLLFHGAEDQLNLGFVKSFFELLGISRDRLLTFNAPTRLENVVVPYPSMSNRAEIFRCHQWVTKLVTETQLKSRTRESSSQPLFFSRTRLKAGRSRYYGEEKLERYLKKKQVLIVDPQTLDLQTQIELVNRHDTIIGIQGSALHNLLFSLDPKKVLYLCSNPGGNYVLIDAVKNNKAMYACCLESLEGPEFVRAWPGKRFKRHYFIVWDNAIQALKNFGI